MLMIPSCVSSDGAIVSFEASGHILELTTYSSLLRIRLLTFEIDMFGSQGAQEKLIIGSYCGFKLNENVIRKTQLILRCS